jgi:hypothetical protein
MKKIITIIAACSLMFLAAACNKAKPVSSNTPSTPIPPPVMLTQTYVNKAVGYTYSYPTNTRVVTSVSYGTYSLVTANTINTEVQDTQNNLLVFVVNEVPSMSALNQQTVAARIKAENLSIQNSTVTQGTIGALADFEVSDNNSSDLITSDRYFVQSPTGKVFELLVVKNNPIAAAILKSFSFQKS